MNIHVADMDGAPRQIRFLGLDYDSWEKREVIDMMVTRAPDAPFTAIVTPNADHLVRIERSPRIAEAYRSAGMRLNDSRIVGALARLRRLPLTTVPGADLVHDLFCDPRFDPAWPILIVGGSADLFALLVARFGLTEARHYDAPMGLLTNPEAMAATIEQIENHPARFILLAIGSPQQELIAQAVQRNGRSRGIGLCIGAAVEFLVHPDRRAPEWMSRTGLEWLFRLMREPRRLWKRYLIDSPKVFALAWRDWRATKTSDR